MPARSCPPASPATPAPTVARFTATKARGSANCCDPPALALPGGLLGRYAGTLQEQVLQVLELLLPLSAPVELECAIKACEQQRSVLCTRAGAAPRRPRGRPATPAKSLEARAARIEARRAEGRMTVMMAEEEEE